MKERYYPLSRYLKERFGRRVQRVTLYCGFSCPNRDGTISEGGCIYCVPETLLPAAYSSGMTVTEQLNTGTRLLGRRYRADKFIAYFQINTNTYAPIERLEGLYREALRHPQVVALCISTRPDCIGPAVLELLARLKEEKHLWIELGLQSAHNRTLELINRGHSVEDFLKAVELTKAYGIEVCTHLILGLPRETKEDMLHTVRLVAELGLWGVKFHQLDVIRGTRLEALYREGFFKPLELEAYAECVVESLELLPPKTTIHRLCGSTPAEHLVAPLWSLDKERVRKRIEELLKERDTFQGRLWNKPERRQ